MGGAGRGNWVGGLWCMGVNFSVVGFKFGVGVTIALFFLFCETVVMSCLFFVVSHLVVLVSCSFVLVRIVFNCTVVWNELSSLY